MNRVIPFILQERGRIVRSDWGSFLIAAHIHNLPADYFISTNAVAADTADTATVVVNGGGRERLSLSSWDSGASMSLLLSTIG